MARAVLEEGLDADGGLLYEGRDGRIINPNKEWWPQAEAVVGFYNAWQLTGDTAFREAAVRCWRFIKDRIVDHERRRVVLVHPARRHARPGPAQGLRLERPVPQRPLLPGDYSSLRSSTRHA